MSFMPDSDAVSSFPAVQEQEAGTSGMFGVRGTLTACFTHAIFPLAVLTEVAPFPVVAAVAVLLVVAHRRSLVDISVACLT